MVTKTTKKKGETSTTVSVGIRIDPKIKFALDIMGRLQKRSLTAVIEWAISNAIAQETVGPHAESMADVISNVWSTDESTRFVLQCFHLPQSLTYDELRVWETIRSSAEFWSRGSSVKTVNTIDLVMLREHWSELLEHVEENKHKSTVIPITGLIPF